MHKNRIRSKSVGSVRIFELSGQVRGAFAHDGEEAIEKIMKAQERQNILFNMRDLDEIESSAVEKIMMQIKKTQKCALITRDPRVRESFRKNDRLKLVAFVDDEREAIRFFSKEFASEQRDQRMADERRFVRLKTVLPVELQCETDSGKHVCLLSIVTNLSENGMFVQFMQSGVEKAAQENLDPYDLKLIDLKIYLSDVQSVEAKGKLIHGSVTDGGVGFEFYQFNGDGKKAIQNWVANNLVSVPACSEAMES